MVVRYKGFHGPIYDDETTKKWITVRDAEKDRKAFDAVADEITDFMGEVPNRRHVDITVASASSEGGTLTHVWVILAYEDQG